VREVDHATGAERRAVTYEALFRDVRGIAAGLAERGVGDGARVGLGLPNGADLIAGYYATWYAGGVAVPVNPSASDPEIEHQLADAAVSLVVAPDGGGAGPAAERPRGPRVDRPAHREIAAPPPPPPARCPPAQ